MDDHSAMTAHALTFSYHEQRGRIGASLCTENGDPALGGSIVAASALFSGKYEGKSV